MKSWIHWKICASWSVMPSVEDPPLAMKEGGIIKDGYNAEVDKFRNAKSDGKNGLPSWKQMSGKDRYQESEDQI